MTARAFDVLCLLVERHGRLVTKDMLFDRVWPGLVVEDNNLQVHISQLRKAIGAAAIATVAGCGYRFTLPCAEARPAAPAPPELYGRDDDLDDIVELAGARRLVSIVGPAGVGKTSLARHALRRLARDFARTAWLDLSAATTDKEVRAPLEELGRAGDGRLLVVLDNADRVSAAAARAAIALLEQWQDLHLLVTTQVRLNLREESVYRLAALPVPTGGTPLPAALSYAAVALLQARVAALDHHFQLDEGNVADAIRVCRRLDGLPLALELGAARIPSLGLRGLLARLDEGLDILCGGDVHAAQRHRSLRNALEWSYALLAPAEQALLRTCSSLPDWFSLEQLAAAAPPDAGLLDGLSTLIDRSFVVFDPVRTPGYTLRETARVFGRGKLGVSGRR